MHYGLWFDFDEEIKNIIFGELLALKVFPNLPNAIIRNNIKITLDLRNN